MKVSKTTKEKADPKQQITELKRTVESNSQEKGTLNTDLEARIFELEKKSVSLEKFVRQLKNEGGMKSVEIKRLSEILASRDRWIQRLQSDLGQRDIRIKGLKQMVDSRDRWIQRLQTEVFEARENRKNWVNKLHDELAKRQIEIRELKGKLPSKTDNNPDGLTKA